MRVFLWLIFLSYTGFCQNKAAVFPDYKQYNQKKLSIEMVIYRIRETRRSDSLHYGDALDFYYPKIAATGKNEWVEKLAEFSLDPDCPAKFKQKINAHIESIRTLQIGELSPDFKVDKFQLSHFHPGTKQILILFYSPSCFHCTELLIDLIPYVKSQKLSVIALQIDNDTNPWVFPNDWILIKATEKIRKDYGVFSTPSLYIIETKSHKISGLPENMEQLKSMKPLF
jgi:thioredoxin-related protein